MAFIGKEGVDFDDFDTAPTYVSLFPNFGSSRKVRNSIDTEVTRRTPALGEDSNNVGEVHQAKPAEAVPVGSERKGVYQNDYLVTVLSVFSIINSLTDYAALAVFISFDTKTEASILGFGLAFALFLRMGAVWQYSKNVTFLSRVSNILFGSRFGWSERYDRKLLARASVGVQFGFPLILHSVSDLVQEGCSFFPLFIVITAGPDALDGVDYGVLLIALLATILSMLGTLLIRISYGARLVELSLLTTYSALFLSFVLLQVTFDEFQEDKIYTRELVFPWLKFLTISTSTFTKTAIEVRSQALITLPAFLTGTVFCILLIDLVAVIFIRTDEQTFIEDDQSLNDFGIVVDQIIYANLAYDIYVAMFMAIQYILITQGDLL